MLLSIIIVNWNVRDALRDCLRSIFLYAPSCEYEIIVIDNASSDGSAGMVRADFPAVRLIENSTNRGFAAACNQGIKVAGGDQFFFLNPDTTVQRGASDTLSAFLEKHPGVGIVAPQLRNPDGTVQPSVRVFPTPLRVFLQLIQADHILPWLSPFVHCQPKFFDSEREADVDQPMGAAFAVPRLVIEKVGMFDERFYLWYEEVDLCRRIKEAGYRIVYVPGARVNHVGAKSFVQKNIFARQAINYESCRTYLKKHFPWRAYGVPFAMGSYALIMRALAWCMKESPKDARQCIDRKVFVGTAGIIAVCEVISYLGFGTPIISSIGFFLVTLAALILGLIRLEYSLLFLLAELIIGSKGYLFSLPIGSFSLSLRMGLFVVLGITWTCSLLRKNKDHFLFFNSSLKWHYLLLGAFVGIGVGTGFLNHRQNLAIYHDANAWLFFLMAIPAYDAFVSRAAIQRAFSVGSAAFMALTAKTLVIFYIMSHKGFGYEMIFSTYRWVRTTGVGEITDMGANFYRIFFQSHIYAVIVFFISITLVAASISRHTSVASALRDTFNNRKGLLAHLAASIALLIISFSRSFWLASVLAGGAWLVLRRWYRVSFVAHLGTAFFVGASALASLAVFFLIATIPIPSTQGGFGFDALASRVQDISQEPAVASRWSLLPVLMSEIRRKPLFGSGFGTTVTYHSLDPRILLQNPSGIYTTYAFEWGYLDIMLKIGIIGLAVYLFLVGALLRKGKKAIETLFQMRMFDDATLLAGWWFGVAALAAIHMVTPYLNHPLGISAIIFFGILIERFSTLSDSEQPSVTASKITAGHRC